MKKAAGLVLFLGMMFPLLALPPASQAEQRVTVLLRQAEQHLKDVNAGCVANASEALELSRRCHSLGLTASSQLMLARAYDRTGQTDKALEYCLEALRGFEALKDAKGQADACEQLGYIYWKLKNGERVQEYFTRSLSLREKLGDAVELAKAYNNIGIFSLHYLNQPEQAYSYYTKALELSRRAGSQLVQANALNNLGNYFLMQSDIRQALSYDLKSLELYRKLDERHKTAVNLLIVGYLYQLRKDFPTAKRYYAETLKLAGEIGSKGVQRDTYLNLSAIYEDEGNRIRHLEFYKQYAELKDSLSNTEANSNIANLQTQFAVEKQELENRILKLSVEKQRILLVGLAAFLLLGAVAIWLILKEKRKSEHLLLNILPRKVARELKQYGRATPQTFRQVTVLFSDFENFTSYSATLQPEQLIGELSEIFTAFDELVEQHGCERIKTIGDAYLAVCGLPEAKADHAERMLRVALGMLDYLKQRSAGSGHAWNIRIGVHTGDVVGGIVGTKKYIYDVFGDAINTASRMESNSQGMRINISEPLYLLVKDRFDCEEREPLPVKGKGLMRMFFVSGEKR